MGATKVNFVNYQYLVDNSPIYANLDPSDIDWVIGPSQDANIERLLGTVLYDKIKTDIINSGTTTGVYKTLLDDYINPALVFFVAYDAVEFNAIQFTNKGLLRKSSENSEPATPEEIQNYKDKLKSMAEYYANRTVKYLIANEGDFPEYTDGNSEEDEINPVNTGYNATFYIPGKGTRKKRYDRPCNCSGNCNC